MLLSSAIGSSGQSLLTFAGGSANGSNGSFAWTAGEIIVSTAKTNKTVATQGFQQPTATEISVVDTLTENPVQVNAITPNGDATNEFFLIKNVHMMPDNRLIILNRWQEIVYKIDGYQNDWNGTTQDGSPLPMAAYYYIFFADLNRKKLVYKGTIHIIR